MKGDLRRRMWTGELRLTIEVWADEDDQCYYATCDQAPPGVRGKGKRIATAVAKLIADMEHFESEGLT